MQYLKVRQHHQYQQQQPDASQPVLGFYSLFQRFNNVPTEGVQPFLPFPAPYPFQKQPLPVESSTASKSTILPSSSQSSQSSQSPSSSSTGTLIDPTMSIEQTNPNVVIPTISPTTASTSSNSPAATTTAPTTPALTAPASTATSPKKVPKKKAAVNKKKAKKNRKKKAPPTIHRTIHQRLIWTNELERRFMRALRLYGVDTAKPKAILDYMNVPGLTRENIGSHLQKYRLRLMQIQKKELEREAAASNAANTTEPSSCTIPLLPEPLSQEEAYSSLSSTSSPSASLSSSASDSFRSSTSSLPAPSEPVPFVPSTLPLPTTTPSNSSNSCVAPTSSTTSPLTTVPTKSGESPLTFRRFGVTIETNSPIVSPSTSLTSISSIPRDLGQEMGFEYLPSSNQGLWLGTSFLDDRKLNFLSFFDSYSSNMNEFEFSN